MKRKLPHVLIPNSPRVVAFFGAIARRKFYAYTYAFWTWVDDDQIGAKQLRHEYAHVVQFTEATVLAIVGFILAQLPWYWWLSLPIVFPIVYLGAGVVAVIPGAPFYRGNFFERDARRYAGEPE